MALDVQRSIPLKISEPVIDSNNPWSDDLLARQAITKQLTNLVATQKPPLAISLHGQWGTGKTFLLMRWQKDLEKEGFKAIYFNAWEDDFCDDPLLAILGQMSETFKQGDLKTLADKVIKTGLALLKKNALSILENKTGMTFDTGQDERSPLDNYLAQRATKDELKNALAKMSEAISNETTHPLVFIIDELDRCRPTFAVELLERVKHIFDAPNLVFVFGVNRDELSKSLKSIYGEINSDVYLRRFFDFEFNLPEVGSQVFAEHLMERFNFRQVFQSLSDAVGHPQSIYDYQNYQSVLPKLWSALGLSLRDVDYGMRLIALLARNVPLGTFTNPFLVAVLIALKFKKPDFYHALITGSFRASDIMNYIEGAVSQDISDRDLSNTLDYIEGLLYCADSSNTGRGERGEPALNDLGEVSDLSRAASATGATGGFPFLSRRAKNGRQAQLDRIKKAILEGRQLSIDGETLGNLAALIDTYQTELRR